MIPAELNSSNKRFNFADLKKGLRYSRSEDNFIWLASAGVALPVYNVAEPTIPLLLNEKSSLFKLYENAVAQELRAHGFKLYYYNSIEEAYILSNYNVEVKENFIYYPIYMLMFIENEAVEFPEISIDDLSLLPTS